MTEFQPWPKIARLNRNITITEKIDGTNAAVIIVPWGLGAPFEPDSNRIAIIGVVGFPTTEFHVYAQSRTRFVTPGKQDNYGFAGWVQRNAVALVETLGEGSHFGEWWGAGIQSKYGLTGGDKRFSLFNTKRWHGNYEGESAERFAGIPGLGVVPVLYEGPFDQYEIADTLTHLGNFGSFAAPGFMRPEGIVIFHHASREMYKVTLKDDEKPKGEAGHALDEEKAA